MTDRSDDQDVRNEPHMFEGYFMPDPSEQTAEAPDGSQDEISTIRDMAANEPAFTGRLDQAELGIWLQQKKAQCSLFGNLMTTLLAAAAAGPFAVIGVFMAGPPTSDGVTAILYRMLYTVVFAPVIEELLKQSGMIYLLEKKPYRIFSAWQFIAAAVISSLIFSAVENLIYIHVYTIGSPSSNLQAFILFRWTVCTLLHVSCSVIASIGLINVWQKQVTESRAADLSVGFRYFAAAMAIHGVYNLAMAVLNLKF